MVFLRREVRCMSVFWGDERAEVITLTVSTYLCLKLAVVLRNTAQAALVLPSRIVLVVHIYSLSSVTQIQYRVIALHLVAMVNLTLGPIPVMQQPRNAMSKVVFAVNPYIDIPLLVEVARNGAGLATGPCAEIPC